MSARKAIVTKQLTQVPFTVSWSVISTRNLFCSRKVRSVAWRPPNSTPSALPDKELGLTRKLTDERSMQQYIAIVTPHGTLRVRREIRLEGFNRFCRALDESRRRSRFERGGYDGSDVHGGRG